MRQLLIFIVTFLFLSCSTNSNKLDSKIQTLEFHYIMWACECANWATASDIEKYQETGNFEDHCVFVEPTDTTLKLADSIGYSGDIIQFTGQYYIDKGLPSNYVKTEEPVEKAKVFRYNSYKIIRSNYRQFINDKDK